MVCYVMLCLFYLILCDPILYSSILSYPGNRKECLYLHSHSATLCCDRKREISNRSVWCNGIILSNFILFVFVSCRIVSYRIVLRKFNLSYPILSQRKVSALHRSASAEFLFSKYNVSLAFLP